MFIYNRTIRDQYYRYPKFNPFRHHVDLSTLPKHFKPACIKVKIGIGLTLTWHRLIQCRSQLLSKKEKLPLMLVPIGTHTDLHSWIMFLNLKSAANLITDLFLQLIDGVRDRWRMSSMSLMWVKRGWLDFLTETRPRLYI